MSNFIKQNPAVYGGSIKSPTQRRLSKMRKERRELISTIQDLLTWQIAHDRGECRSSELDASRADALALLKRIGEPLVLEKEPEIGQACLKTMPAHPILVKCPICTDLKALFASAHPRGPSCVKCRQPFTEPVGTPKRMFWRCSKCGNTEPAVAD